MSTKTKSRRHFLLRFFSREKDLMRSGVEDSSSGAEKIKMLTPDGKLVEVIGPLPISHTQKKKTSNAEILKWMGVKKNC
jgi:hypothetical protein